MPVVSSSIILFLLVRTAWGVQQQQWPMLAHRHAHPNWVPADWADLGAGCCPTSIKDRLFDGPVEGGLEGCIRKCQEFSKCGYINYGWMNSQWCTVIGKRKFYQCWSTELSRSRSGLVTGNQECGSSAQTGVHAYRYMKDVTSPRRNICMDGHFVPEVMLLGAQKSSTSELACALNTSTQLHFGANFQSEESHVSSQKESHVFDKDGDWENGRDAWLEHYPACAMRTREVHFDGTPNYLKATEDFSAKEAKLRGNAAPVLIRQWYGHKAKHLMFIVLLRDPLRRMQSAFYQGISDGWCPYTQSDGVHPHSGSSFSNYVKDVLSLEHLANEPCDLFQNSLYGMHLARWLFAGFKAGQFHIVPMRKVATPGDLLHTTYYFWNMLGIDADDKAADKIMEIGGGGINVGKHPSLSQELSRIDQEALEARMVDTVYQEYHKFLPHLFADPVDKPLDKSQRSNAAVLGMLLVHNFRVFGYQGPARTAKQMGAYFAEEWSSEP